MSTFNWFYFLVVAPSLMIWAAFKTAPLGYEDEKGFHHGEEPEDDR